VRLSWLFCSQSGAFKVDLIDWKKAIFVISYEHVTSCKPGLNDLAPALIYGDAIRRCLQLSQI